MNVIHLQYNQHNLPGSFREADTQAGAALLTPARVKVKAVEGGRQ